MRPHLAIDLREQWKRGEVCREPRWGRPVKPELWRSSGLLMERGILRRNSPPSDWIFGHLPDPRSRPPLSTEDRIVFVFHGFLKDGQKAYGMSTGFCWLMEAVAPELLGSHLLIPVAWPADPRLVNPVRFGLIDELSRQAGHKLAHLVRHQLRGRSYSFVAQSQGNRVALECLQRLLRHRLPIDHFISTGAAVENTVFTDKRLYRQATRRLEGIQVLHSERDWVLRGVYDSLGKRQVRRLATKNKRRVPAHGYPKALGRTGVPPRLRDRDFGGQREPRLHHTRLENANHAAYMPQRLEYAEWKDLPTLRRSLLRRIEDGEDKAHQLVRSAYLTAMTLLERTPRVDLPAPTDSADLLRGLISAEG